MTRPSNFAIVFDTETTGLIENGARPLKDQPHIIELTALRIDLNDFAFGVHDNDWPGDRDKMIEEAPMFTSLFNFRGITEETTRITGITQDLVDLAPSFASKSYELAEFVHGSRWLVGHNLSYDRDMLAIELRRLDILLKFPWPMKHLCTVEATENKEGFRLGLNDLHEKLIGMRFNEHHRSEPDTRATARIFVELVRRRMVRV
jgi:DNA polymerase-3 subunit alpha